MSLILLKYLKNPHAHMHILGVILKRTTLYIYKYYKYTNTLKLFSRGTFVRLGHLHSMQRQNNLALFIILFRAIRSKH